MKIIKAITERTTPFYSLEFFPPKEKEQWESFFTVVETLMAIDPLFASVTYGAGGSAQENTLELIATLKQRFQLELMAHLTCIGAAEERIKAFIEKLQHLGVDNVLALRGDLPSDASPEQASSSFQHAIDLVRFVRRACPNMGLAVAGYPSPHPESPSFSSDWRHTVSKIREGADVVITQLFFDVREYFAFVDRLDDMGVSVPVIPGILPVQSLASLRRTLTLCGASIPGKLYFDLEDAHKRGGSEAVKEAGIAYAVEQIRTLIDGGAPGIHLYTLNKADTCLQIVQEVGKR